MNVINTYISAAAIALFAGNGFSQTTAKPDKVSHAEPLYLDLVRDLGARKGEKELDAGMEISQPGNYNEHAFLVEYEFAPINRLGLEIEADLSFFRRTGSGDAIPANKLECLRFSGQYSFLVSTALQTTLAVGYTQSIGLTGFRNYGKSSLFTGTVYNPFLVAAKCWGQQFHTLVYGGPLLEHDFAADDWSLNWQINTSFHYCIPQSRHFIGIELNQEINGGKFEVTVRPQAKLKLNKQVALGLVTGIPVNKRGEGCSSFLRIIYEP